MHSLSDINIMMNIILYLVYINLHVHKQNKILPSLLRVSAVNLYMEDGVLGLPARNPREWHMLQPNIMDCLGQSFILCKKIFDVISAESSIACSVLLIIVGENRCRRFVDKNKYASEHYCERRLHELSTYF